MHFWSDEECSHIEGHSHQVTWRTVDCPSTKLSTNQQLGLGGVWEGAEPVHVGVVSDLCLRVL